MKKIYSLLIVLMLFFLGIYELHAANIATGQPVEQTQDFAGTIMGLFSMQIMLNIIFAVVTIVLTLIASKFVQNRLFSYLENSNIGDEGSKEELIGVISRVINVIVLVAGFSIALGVLGVDLGIFM